MSLDEYQDDLHAELGYRSAGRREVYQREWYSLRGDPNEAAPTPKAFDALVNRLRAKNWAKQNPEKRRAIARRYAAKPGMSAHSAALSKKRRHERFHASNPVTVCAECGVEFCPIAIKGGQPRKFCETRCATRNRYLRSSNPGRRQRRRLRLTAEQSQAICARFDAGERAVLIAADFGISRLHVNALWRKARESVTGRRTVSA